MGGGLFPEETLQPPRCWSLFEGEGTSTEYRPFSYRMNCAGFNRITTPTFLQTSWRIHALTDNSIKKYIELKLVVLVDTVLHNPTIFLYFIYPLSWGPLIMLLHKVSLLIFTWPEHLFKAGIVFEKYWRTHAQSLIGHRWRAAFDPLFILRRCPCNSPLIDS